MPMPASNVPLFEVLYQCRAMRRLKPDPVPESVLLQLVDAAIHAPSASNGQNWRFVIVRDRAQKERIAKIWRKGFGFYQDTVLRAGPHGHEDRGAHERAAAAMKYLVDHLEEVPAFVFVGVETDPLVAKASASPSAVVALFRNLGFGGLTTLAGARRSAQRAEDATAFPAVQNLLLAARALGLGALITLPQTFSPGRFEVILGLPRSVSLCAVVPVGYPLGNFGPVRRPPAEGFVAWDRHAEPGGG